MGPWKQFNATVDAATGDPLALQDSKTAAIGAGAKATNIGSGYASESTFVQVRVILKASAEA